MSGIQTACATPESNRDVGGIIFTPGGVQGTRTAGHELGHMYVNCFENCNIERFFRDTTK